MTAGRGVEVLLAVVLADAEGVEPDLVGALDLLEQVLHALGRARRQSGDGVGDRRDEAVDADSHRDLAGSAGRLNRFAFQRRGDQVLDDFAETDQKLVVDQPAVCVEPGVGFRVTAARRAGRAPDQGDDLFQLGLRPDRSEGAG